MKFTTTSPLTVTDVIPYSHACELGVQKRWKLIQIGDELVESEDADFVRTALRDATLVLPLV